MGDENEKRVPTSADVLAMCQVLDTLSRVMSFTEMVPHAETLGQIVRSWVRTLDLSEDED